MKKILIALLLFGAAALFAAESDVPFSALMEWSTELDSKTLAWNQHCKQETSTECDTVREILVVQLRQYINEAATYKATGTDCRAALRQRTVRQQMAVCEWNIQCVGRSANSPCTILSDAIDAEMKKLDADIKECTAEKL